MTPPGRGRYWDEFTVGEVLVTGRRTVDGGDVSRFAGLTGDFNPLHIDAEFARTTLFGERVAHGILTLAVSNGQQNLAGWFEGTTVALLGLDKGARSEAVVEGRSRRGRVRCGREEPARRGGVHIRDGRADAEASVTSPVLEAIYRGDRPAVDRMIADGVTLTLCEAAALGDAPRVRALARAEPAALARRSPDGWPALHLAAHFGHGDAVDALVDARADVRAYSDNHEANTALHAALAGRGGLRVVRRLLAAGADVNARAAGGYTPLHIVAFGSDLALMDTLLAHGADAAARADDGKTALVIAEENGHPLAARRLRGEMP
jgi:acyl dehydratase